MALAAHGASPAAALTGGLHVAFAVCGATAIAAVIVARTVIGEPAPAAANQTDS